MPGLTPVVPALGQPAAGDAFDGEDGAGVDDDDEADADRDGDGDGEVVADPVADDG